METNKSFPTGKRELFLLVCMLLCGLGLCNFILWGGFNLGFAIAATAGILATAVYLLIRGCKPTFYSLALIVLSLALSASFARADDGFVKAVLLVFLFIGANLGLCLLAKQNRRDPGRFASLLDAFRPPFALAYGKLPHSTRGLFAAFRRTGTLGSNGLALLVGLGVALPILGVMIPLLMRADAAFEGLLDLLPSPDLLQILVTLFLGIPAAYLLYTKGTALRHAAPKAPRVPRQRKGINALTVNTVLCAVCGVYCVYLLSQLAYFAGGFQGILPEGYTMAEYARRGFFEMAWLCALDLAILSLAMGLVRKACKAPLSTRLLCLFIGLVTLFLVSTASAKMFLYIGSYGLTRLRVLTQVIMLFLAAVTVLVMLRLFLTRLPYMKGVILTAMILGSAVAWADVDTLVAGYNVNAYLEGRVEDVDMAHLSSLGDGAVPHIARLLDREETAEKARDVLTNRERRDSEDFRGWNYVNYEAAKYLSPIAGLDVLLPQPQEQTTTDSHGFFGDGLLFTTMVFPEEQAAQLESQLTASDAWSPMPLSAEPNLDKLVYGRTSYSAMVGPYLTEDGSPVFPRVENGWYFFRDRHGDARYMTREYSIQTLFDRYSLNVTMAIYDADTNTLYYCQYDS